VREREGHSHGRIRGPDVEAVEPILRMADGARRGVLMWWWPEEVTALSSAAVGGGPTRPDWVLNIGVDSGYGRTDLAEHAAGVASALDLPGHGVALFTAADVARPSRSTEDGVAVHATVGVSHPTWAASGAQTPRSARADTGDPSRSDTDVPPPSLKSATNPAAGTINVVIQLPVTLAGGAAVNAVITATEAKAQALLEAGVDGTGTATDAVVVVWPSAAERSERFAGPRSPWGARIGRCVHAAVREGLAT